MIHAGHRTGRPQNDLFDRAAEFRVFKVDLLYVVCLPDADKRGVADVEFAERLEGDALYAASEAFLEALADFFQKLRRTHVVRAIEKQREVVAKAVQMAEQTIDFLVNRLNSERLRIV